MPPDPAPRKPQNRDFIRVGRSRIQGKPGAPIRQISGAASYTIKGTRQNQVALVGVDGAGHTVLKNSSGEMFYLDQAGDMVPVK